MKRGHGLIIELLVPPLLAGVRYSVGGLYNAPSEWFMPGENKLPEKSLRQN